MIANQVIESHMIENQVIESRMIVSQVIENRKEAAGQSRRKSMESDWTDRETSDLPIACILPINTV